MTSDELLLWFQKLAAVIPDADIVRFDRRHIFRVEPDNASAESKRAPIELAVDFEDGEVACTVGHLRLLTGFNDVADIRDALLEVFWLVEAAATGRYREWVVAADTTVLQVVAQIENRNGKLTSLYPHEVTKPLFKFRDGRKTEVRYVGYVPVDTMLPPP